MAPQFHPLTVTGLRKTTRDAVVVTLQPQAADAPLFRFTQGQYLTFRRDFGGQELRRSYSICAGRDDGHLQVGIKRVEGGAFSSWANEALQAGDVLQAMPPMGSFHDPALGAGGRLLGFAAGSGITPVLSILRTALAEDAGAHFTLVYANRSASTIMFREELEDLKDRHMGRFSLIHILGRDAHEIELFSGRIDAQKCAGLFRHWIDLPSIDRAYICGPEPLMQVIAGSLRDHGMASEKIRYELFGAAQPGRAPRKAVSGPGKDVAGKISLSITLDGTTQTVEMARDQSVLQAGLANALDLPFACQAGVCSTCKCKLVEGEVEMLANHALEDYEVERGYRLACQSYPLTDRVAVDYDQ